jgi:hypothetical protein
VEPSSQDPQRQGAYIINELAKVLGLEEDEFEIYRDYQLHGAMDSDRLLEIVRHEAKRRRLGLEPVTGAMVQAGGDKRS